MPRKRLAFIFLFLIVVVPLLIQGIRMVQKSIVSSVWDGTNHVTIVVDNEDLEVWSLEPSDKYLVRLIIPKNTYLAVAPHGAYRASAISNLSLLEKKDSSLLLKAVSTTLAIPIDGAIARKEGTARINLIDLLGFGGLGNMFVGDFLTGRSTNITMYDMVRLWFYSFTIKGEGIETVEITDVNGISEFTLPDGTKSLQVDKERFSKIAAKYFTDKQIKEENKAIEIVNGTTTEGIANNAALVFTNIGGNVINTAKGEHADQTIVFAEKDSYTAQKAAKIVGGTWKKEMPKNSRADIVIVLGEDMK